MVLTLLSDSTTYKCLQVQCTLMHCLSKWTSDLVSCLSYAREPEARPLRRFSYSPTLKSTASTVMEKIRS